jgi:cell division protein FtsI/penicillin-binding protein 2
MKKSYISGTLAILSLLTGAALHGMVAETTTRTTAKKKTVAKKPAAKAVAAKPVAAKPVPRKTVATIKAAPVKKGWVQTWDEPTYKDSAQGDRLAGEDQEIRAAAIGALGPMNGSIVVSDPGTGRILSIVNQQLALGGGFQPCSTIKIPVALAALREGLVTRVTPGKVHSKWAPDLTDAIAFSNNSYFANLGIRLGYDRVNYYAHLFGYGEKAGLNIDGEHPGYFPPAPPKNGGMGMLTSFGEEISQTPLETAAFMGAVANGGTLYWLQWPSTEDDVKNFQPRVKRRLDIGDLVDTIKPGMQGAVEFGTAKRARQDDVILGKTGTCSEGRTHLGWFTSFVDGTSRKLVVVVLLTGGRPSVGAMASEVAGDFYKRLAAQNFFRSALPVTAPSIMPSTFAAR